MKEVRYSTKAKKDLKQYRNDLAKMQELFHVKASEGETVCIHLYNTMVFNEINHKSEEVKANDVFSHFFCTSQSGLQLTINDKGLSLLMVRGTHY